MSSLPVPTAVDVEIDAVERLPDLLRLNEIWIREHFQIEQADERLADDPEAILRAGGHTLTATDGGEVVGVVALFAAGPGEYELARMAVAPSHRGKGIGRRLALSALRLAKDRGARRVFLLSNKRLSPALRLYESLGFRVVQEGPHPEYSRCDVVMEKLLKDS